MKILSDTRVPVKIWASELEVEAEQQVRAVAGLPFIHSHVAVMPDAHAGKGSTVGTVIATKGAIVPATVGCDIGCGMIATKLPFKIDVLKDLPKLRHSIERSVPVGMNTNNKLTDSSGVSFNSLGKISDFAQTNVRSYDRLMANASKSLGSLGGGNHFIEICHDTNNDVWIMLHSGSRNIGKVLAELHINKAKDLMKQYFITPPNIDLSYLVQGTPEFSNYLHDLDWAQKFAKANREEMMDRVLREVLYHTGNLELYKTTEFFTVNCHHNYTNLENVNGHNVYVTRKGAVSAREGEYGIIPGSMGTKSFIVKGLGNKDSFYSCSHGAGRRMSRTKARNTFTVSDLESQTSGVECRKDVGVLDEIPDAYKSIDTVMSDQVDLVIPVYELKQVLCIKG